MFLADLPVGRVERDRCRDDVVEEVMGITLRSWIARVDGVVMLL